jgi:hypothetical protein
MPWNATVTLFPCQFEHMVLQIHYCVVSSQDIQPRTNLSVIYAMPQSQFCQCLLQDREGFCFLLGIHVVTSD